MIQPSIWVSAVGACTAAALIGAAAPEVSRDEIAPPGLSQTPPLKRLDDGVYQLGPIELNKKARTVRFPATINMDQGLIEYFCVTEIGKLHESLLRTAVSPTLVHLAVLMISRPGEIPAPASIQQMDFPAGPTVELSVVWSEDGRVRSAKAEELILNQVTGKAMASGNWRYTSSRTHETVFFAERDGLVVALIEDLSALINNADEDRANDEIWYVYQEKVPPLDTSVELSLRLVDQKREQPAPRGANRPAKRVAAPQHGDQHKEGIACPKCETKTIRRTEFSSKGSQPRVVVFQRHACPACTTSLEVRGHGKMKETVVSHACSELGDATKNCCAKRQ